MDPRTAAFQSLKPTCVALGESAKAFAEGRQKGSVVTKQLETLKRSLSSITAKADTLHPKLAEYVFFPISQVLRASQKTSIHSLELCLQCIGILVDQGWRQRLPAQTAAQLVILCTLLAEKNPQGLSFAESTDELQASAFWCLHHVFAVAGLNAETKTLLTNEAHFPQLGKTISVMLDGIGNSGSPTAQEAASSALETLMTNVAGREIHASFLPGVVSKLTRILTPSTKARRSARVLTQCLNIVTILIRSTLSADRKVTGCLNTPGLAGQDIDEEWQKQAATQLRPALANIAKLRSHRSDEVKAALGQLCLTLLKGCRETLSNCSLLALETLATICTDGHNSAISIELEMLLQANPAVASLLQDLLFGWLQSLTTTMQSADEDAKAAKMQQISMVYRLLLQSGAEMTILDQTAAAAMRDGVISTLASLGDRQQLSDDVSRPSPLDLVTSSPDSASTTFATPLVQSRGQQKVVRSIADFVELAVRSSSRASTFHEGFLRSLRQSHGAAQVANFWLLLTAVDRPTQGDVDAFLDFEEERSLSHSEALEDLYSFSLTILTETSEEAWDAQLRALALRTLALRARLEGRAFRYELVDALYPILHSLATPEEKLRRDSITTLNIVTSACGYASVKDLIVDNVDYLTNAVALKLNAFDVSPQAPQVLLMMVRLAGPSLLPYLEDTIESIFAALEDYHGYPLLVELLFKVLGVMAEEGVNAPQLAIEPHKDTSREEGELSSWTPPTIEGLAMQLRILAQDAADEKNAENQEREPHPKRPWGRTSPSRDAEEEDGLDTGGESQPQDDAVVGPPAPRTYSLLLKITELTQHFLPSASPSLRVSLLGLIRTTSPVLAKHEDSFLPLINTLWPEVVSRLEDDEPHVIAAGLEIVSVLCECAGDFMRTRILQLWPRLVEIYEDVAKEAMQWHSRSQRSIKATTTHNVDAELAAPRLYEALSRMGEHSSSYIDTSTKLLWPALERAITAAVRDVKVSADTFDQALDMMKPVLDKEPIRSAFSKESSDAVWLACLKMGRIPKPRVPSAPVGHGWRFAALPG